MNEPVDVRPIKPFICEQALEAWRENPRANASACARAWGVPRTTARRWLAQWQKNHGALATAFPPADMVTTMGIQFPS
jgi:transposase-like protein